MRALIGAMVMLVCAVLPPAGLASDVTGIGYVDEAALAQLASFQAANRQFEAYQTQVQQRFAGQMRAAKTANEQQAITDETRNALKDEQTRLFAPLFEHVQTAVASAASSRNLSVVLDKRIVIYGGIDLTKDVADLLTDLAAPVPPATKPSPSNVGFVDQTQIDAIPKLKAASDAYAKFEDEQTKAIQVKMRSAKTDAERRTIFESLQKVLTGKRSSLIDPLVDRTKSAIGTIAQKKDLVLVVDRSTLLYGGTDVTNDVVSALQ
ncbi:MAG TPA: OmpH family outer membrane protein [Candidatus Baltobacteraceae bacterium]|nr:OmpH family outer membrane protein [Candidatus Baltobacteraceae bacterium]